MLFYASEKYPLEDSYSKYITEVLLFIYLFYVSSFHLLKANRINKIQTV